MCENEESKSLLVDTVRLVDELDACIDELRGSAALLAAAGIAWGEQQACGVLLGSIEKTASQLEGIMELLEQSACVQPR